ncbi:70-kilodalton heat shock protein, partial [Linnemannia exigua]
MLIDPLAKDIDYSTTVTHARFEKLNADLFESILDPVGTVLKDAKLDKSLIDEIVLVGGPNRIPIIQQLLSDFFNGKKLNTSLDVTKMLPVAQTEGSGGEMDSIVRHNLSLSIVKGALINHVKGSMIMVPIFEGKTVKQARDNNLLGNLVISDIPLEHRTISELKVSFDVDSNGLLDIVDETPKVAMSQFKVTQVKGGLSKEEIKRMGKGCGE